MCEIKCSRISNPLVITAHKASHANCARNSTMIEFIDKQNTRSFQRAIEEGVYYAI